MIGSAWTPKEFLSDAVAVAPKLLGQYLVHQTPDGLCAGRIVETEAYGCTYGGVADDGSHSFRGLTSRTAPMFHSGGISYVYLIYGMYSCFNVVTGPSGQGQAVLVRAVEPVIGMDLMAGRRKAKKLGKNLTNGPGKLCQAFGITREQNELDLTGACLYIAHSDTVSAVDIVQTTRINIDYATYGKHFPWRFYIKDNPYVSKVL